MEVRKIAPFCRFNTMKTFAAAYTTTAHDPMTTRRRRAGKLAPCISIVFIVLFFIPLSHVPAAAPGGATIGQIVTITGNITSINTSAGSITVASGNVFFVTFDSVLNINGKRGGISDLAMGMKVSGSAEVAKAETRNGPQKRIIRMLTATTDPSYVQPEAPSTPPQRPPGMMPGYPGAAMQGGVEGMTKRLSGTFWSIPSAPATNGKVVKQWLSLNANGTTTSSLSDTLGTWTVSGPFSIQVQFFVGQRLHNTSVNLHPSLNSGSDLRFPAESQAPYGAYGMRQPYQGPFAWTLIDSPTPDMLAKAPARPAPESLPGSVPSPTPVQVSAESQQAASEIVKVNHNNLVFVTGKEGAGSGFIADIDGTTYLVTNAHVAAGISDADFKTLDGTVVHGGEAVVAVGHDIFRMLLPAGGKPFEAMKRVDENAGIGDEIVVLGNAEGSGVINTIMGRIVGIGPNLVEIDAQFVPGNSGSPIVHLKSGKVIGVATYTVVRKYDATTKVRMKEPIVRRFGYRIDSVKTWQPVTMQTFHAQAAIMEKIHELTEALDNFFRDLYENRSHITIAKHTNPVIKARISQWQEVKSHKLSAMDRETADANLLSFLKVACQTDLAGAQRSLTYDYFQRRLSDEQETRNEMAKAFTDIIKNIRD